MIEMTPSWFTDKPATPDRLGSRARMRGPSGGPMDPAAAAPATVQPKKMDDAEMSGLEALIPGLGG
jgi:hypothetical protein